MKQKEFYIMVNFDLAYIIIVQSVKEYQTWSKNETCLIVSQLNLFF